MQRLRAFVVFLGMLAAVVWLASGAAQGNGGGGGGTNCGGSCPTRTQPICARQGASGAKKSFANQCELDRYNCRFGQSLRKIKDGSC